MKGISPSSPFRSPAARKWKRTSTSCRQSRLAASHAAAQQLANRLPPILVQPVAEQLHVVMSHCQLGVARKGVKVNDAIGVAVDNSDHVHN